MKIQEEADLLLTYELKLFSECKYLSKSSKKFLINIFQNFWHFSWQFQSIKGVLGSLYNNGTWLCVILWSELNLHLSQESQRIWSVLARPMSVAYFFVQCTTWPTAENRTKPSRCVEGESPAQSLIGRRQVLWSQALSRTHNPHRENYGNTFQHENFNLYTKTGASGLLWKPVQVENYLLHIFAQTFWIPAKLN